MIKELELLRMPNRASLAALGDKARFYFGHGDDGDLLLAMRICFNDDEIAAAIAAGAEIVTGYSFEYFYPVTVKRAGVTGWWACSALCCGFALSREVAERVSAVSRAEFIEDIQRCHEEQEQKRRIYAEIERGLRGRWVY